MTKTLSYTQITKCWFCLLFFSILPISGYRSIFQLILPEEGCNYGNLYCKEVVLERSPEGNDVSGSNLTQEELYICGLDARNALCLDLICLACFLGSS